MHPDPPLLSPHSSLRPGTAILGRLQWRRKLAGLPGTAFWRKLASLPGTAFCPGPYSSTSPGKETAPPTPSVSGNVPLIFLGGLDVTSLPEGLEGCSLSVSEESPLAPL